MGKNWHWDDKYPFNHPALLAGARKAFHGKESRVNKFTISQLGFAAAVVSTDSDISFHIIS